MTTVQKVMIGVGGFVGILLIAVVSMVVMYFNYNNHEMRLRNQITAVQTNNKNVYDNAIKTISQTADITTEQSESIRKILVGYADARGGSSGKVASMLTEAIPNLDRNSDAYINLQNILVSSRAKIETNQKALLDLSRAHNDALTIFPSSFFTGLAGKTPIDVVIVTSTRTENSFVTGVDDNTEVFNKKR